MTPATLRPRSPLAKLAIVIPFFNEEEVLPALKQRLEALLASLPCQSEVLCVNDGSRDLTPVILERWALDNPHIKVVSLARNFGHQVAVTAGLDYTSPDCEAVVIMDGDLQDPPEVIREMIAKYEQGYDVVYGRRVDREGETFFKRSSAFVFYRVMRWAIDPNLPVDTGDFRLMSRRSLNSFLLLRERHRFLRGMATWIGYPQTDVQFARPQRQGGVSKYSLGKMLALSWNAVVSFSPLPLRVGLVFGLFVTLFGLGYAVYSVFRYFVVRDTVPGWTTLVILQCLIGGAILIGLGVTGEYIAKLFEEIKARPLYIVQETCNIPGPSRPESLRAAPGASAPGRPQPW